MLQAARPGGAAREQPGVLAKRDQQRLIQLISQHLVTSERPRRRAAVGSGTNNGNAKDGDIEEGDKEVHEIPALDGNNRSRSAANRSSGGGGGGGSNSSGSTTTPSRSAAVGGASSPPPKVWPREFVVVGINAVARALDRGQLSAVLTCGDVRPTALLAPLRDLSARAGVAGVPHCELLGVQRVLAHVFQMPRVNAIGIRADHSSSVSGTSSIDVDDLCGMVAANSVHRHHRRRHRM